MGNDKETGGETKAVPRTPTCLPKPAGTANLTCLPPTAATANLTCQPQTAATANLHPAPCPALHARISTVSVCQHHQPHLYLPSPQRRCWMRCATTPPTPTMMSPWRTPPPVSTPLLPHRLEHHCLQKTHTNASTQCSHALHAARATMHVFTCPDTTRLASTSTTMRLAAHRLPRPSKLTCTFNTSYPTLPCLQPQKRTAAAPPGSSRTEGALRLRAAL